MNQAGDAGKEDGGNTDGASVQQNLMKPLPQEKTNIRSEGGRNTNGEGNNSDNSANSALVSLGYTSFGFNFDDSEESMSNPADQSDRDSDSNAVIDSKGASRSDGRNTMSSMEQGAQVFAQAREKKDQAPNNNSPPEAFHDVAAEAAVAELYSIALTSIPAKDQHGEDEREGAKKPTTGKRSRSINEKCGYKSNSELDQVANETARHDVKPEEAASSSISHSPLNAVPSNDSVAVNDSRDKKKQKLDEKKREERNAREKERSFRISKQINELRALLSSGGVIVPKGTKSSVLTETANYIVMLQQHQYRSEIDRQQLIQQIQMIGGGAHGPQAAAAIRHVAAQNGVWTLDNQLNAAVKSSVQFLPSNGTSSSELQGSQNAQSTEQDIQPLQQTRIEDHEYRSVFDNCSVGMEVCALTIFNLTARQDLQHAFDLISQLISPSMDRNQVSPQPVVLRGAMNNGNDLGLSVTLVKAEDGIAKCFCVTLIKNPASPFDEARPIPATIELVHGTPTLSRHPSTKDGCSSLESVPAFTSG